MKGKKIFGVNFLKIILIFFFLVIIGLICYIISLKYVGDNKSDSMLIDLTKVTGYVNFDGTYASMKQINFYDEYGRIHSINLGLDGKVYYGNFGLREDIINVSDAIDIVLIQGEDGFLDDTFCYILTNDGQIYVYVLNNIIEEKYEATLMDSYSDVSRIFKVNYAKEEDSSSVNGVLAVLKNGEYVRID